jgi:drug/metabolite transporter (DMT)-like permease
MASAALLAGVYFLNAFIPPDFERDENEKFGMKELVLMTILPKILWISSAVCMAGFFVLSQNQEHDAHLNLWFIGGFALFGSLVILSFAIVTGNKHTRVLTAVAFRAVPLLVLVTYFYLNS